MAVRLATAAADSAESAEGAAGGSGMSVWVAWSVGGSAAASNSCRNRGIAAEVLPAACIRSARAMNLPAFAAKPAAGLEPDGAAGAAGVGTVVGVGILAGVCHPS
jgi:hypothetical protein